jgi:isoleucyl-tRNA synthetase
MQTYPGKCLVGIEYEPLFDDFVKMNEEGALPKGFEIGENAYKVILGHHVTTESGTGVVHIAPAYGEDDFQIGKKEKLGFVSSIDATGNVEYLGEYNGQYVFDFNETVIKRLKDQKVLVHLATMSHSYPHCYRCGNPLIYRAISSWYLNVESIKDRMVANNQKVRWVPENIKD